MALILSIETSTIVCSVALHKNETCISCIDISEPNAHSSKLTVLLEDILKQSSLSIADIDAIAISEGPGSYTGLRIGTSVAKGLCYAAQKPLIAVPTLKALSMQAGLSGKLPLLGNDILCPMIDARRMEVYTAEFSADYQCITPTYARIIGEENITEFNTEKNYYLFGDGSEKFKEILQAPHIHVIPHITPSAQTVGICAYAQYVKQDFVDVAYFEPFYLKEFQATTPKKKI